MASLCLLPLIAIGGSEQALDHETYSPSLPIVDHNDDGYLNAMDVAELMGLASGQTGRGTGAERLVAELPAGGIPSVPAGESVAFQIRLENSTTPLFGYSLGVSVEPLPGSGGAVNAVVEETNFFPPRNLITAAGLELDPLFSVILDDGDGGVFINGNTSDGSTTIAVPEVNDILAEIVVLTEANALGEFEVRLSGATVLADGGGFAVPYEYNPLVINVTIAPCSGADLTEPFQILDLNDLVEFAVLFQNQDPRVDFAVPVGLFDLADVLQFVQFFLDGC